MSNGSSDFVHLSATPSAGHDTSSSNQSELSTLSNAKHVRMGRGLIKVKRYENEASRGVRRSPTSPISPVSAADDVLGHPPKRKWFQSPLLRRRNVSMGGLPTDRIPSDSVKRGEVKSWLDTQARERWDSTSQRGPETRPATFDIPRENLSSESSLTPTPSRLELSIDPRSDAALPSNLTNSSNDTPTVSRRVSPLRNLLPQSPEEEDEDGRALLEALGLEESNSVTEQAYQIEEDQPQTNNISDYESEVEEEPASQLPYALPHIRPLPAIPLLPASSSTESQAQPIPRFNVPPPHDSQDAYTYVFGSSPRTSAHYRQSTGPPPPYASRHSAMLNRPTISREEMTALQQHLRSMEIPEVAPLAIRKRDDKSAPRRLIVENN